MALKYPTTMPNPEYGGYSFQPSTVPVPSGGMASQVGSTLNAGGGAAMTSGVPPLMAAGVAMQGAGLLANIYGAYQADKAAKEQAREEQRRFNLQLQAQQQKREDDLRQQDFSNDMASGQYAQNYKSGVDSAYGNYYAKNRM